MNQYFKDRQFDSILKKASLILEAEESNDFAGFIPVEIVQLMKHRRLRLGDNGADLRLARHLAGDPDDPELQRLFAQRVIQKWNMAENQDDPFYENYPPPGYLDPTQENIILGQMPNGEPVGIPADRDTVNIGIYSPTGGGKTEEVKGIIPQLVNCERLVIAFDKKEELWRLATLRELYGKVVLLTYDAIMISLLQPPPVKGVEETWLDEVTRLLAECYGRLSAQRLSRQIFAELLDQMPPGEYPALSQIIAAHEAFRARFRSRESEYRESMLWVLKDLQNYSHGIFEYTQSDFLSHLFEEPRLIVIEAGVLPPDHFQFLITYIMRWLYVWRLGAQEFPFRVIFVLEDLTGDVDRNRDRYSPSGMQPLAQQIFMGRGLDMGLICIQHNPSGNPLMFQNTETHIAMRIQGLDDRQLSTLFGTQTPEQNHKLRSLLPGEIVVWNPHVWHLPIYASFEPLALGHPSELERRRLAEGFLQKVRAAKPVGVQECASSSKAPRAEESRSKQSEQPVDSHTLEEMQLLLAAGKGMNRSLGKFYEDLKMSRTQGNRIVKRLEKQGLVRPHQFTTGRQGGRVTVLEVTSEGYAVLKAYGVGPFAKKTGGGWEHDWAASLIGRAGARQQMRVTYEEDLGGIRADVVWNDAKGNRIFFNIGVSSPDREAANALRAVQLPALQGNRFVVVGRDSAFAKAVNQAYESLPADTAMVNRIEVQLIADFLDG